MRRCTSRSCATACATAGRRSPSLTRASGAGRLAPLHVVDLEYVGLGGELDPGFGQHRHELLSERLELLAGVPALADHEVVGRTEADVVIEPLRRKADRLNLVVGRVVLLGGQVGRVKTHDDAHGEVLFSGSRRPYPLSADLGRHDDATEGLAALDVRVRGGGL